MPKIIFCYWKNSKIPQVPSSGNLTAARRCPPVSSTFFRPKVSTGRRAEFSFVPWTPFGFGHFHLIRCFSSVPGGWQRAGLSLQVLTGRFHHSAVGQKGAKWGRIFRTKEFEKIVKIETASSKPGTVFDSQPLQNWRAMNSPRKEKILRLWSQEFLEKVLNSFCA